MDSGRVKNRIDRKTCNRIWVFFVIIVLFACTLIGRLASFQIAHGEEYQAIVLNQMTKQADIAPVRGKIYDRNGNLLATNITVYNVIISPDDIRTRMESDRKLLDDDKIGNEVVYELSDAEAGLSVSETDLSKAVGNILSAYLDVDRKTIDEKMAKEGRKYELIKKEVEASVADKLKEFISKYELKNQIYFEEGSKRYYPMGSLAAHVIGFVNSEGVGIYGLEAYYNNLLEGTSGKYIASKDAHSNDMPFGYQRIIEAKNGCDIAVTLDVYVQHELENQLKQTFLDSQAGNRVCGVVMDVDTGEILAMATYPAFDLNDPYELDEYSRAQLDAMGLDKNSEEYSEAYYEKLFTMWNNKAVTETYEPGSTFKVITTAMAFEENVVSEYDYFTCLGYLYVEGWDQPIACADEDGHGTVPFKYGLQQSCNPTLMQVAQRVGREKFYQYFDLFGYRDITGVDLPGESRNIYLDYTGFTSVSLAVYSFGQTFKVTPLQQTRAIAAIANGGTLLTPHFLKTVMENGTPVQSYGSAVVREVISANTCRRITDILEEGVATDGAAKNAYVKGYRVAAKTGTSEKLDKYDEYGERSYRVGSTVAYAPADDPKVISLIMVDEPMGGIVYGGSVAAPYVSKLLSDVLPYLGVEPRYTTDELAALDVVISNYEGATLENSLTDLSWRNFRYEIIGSGDTVTAQVPASGSRISSDTGILLLYTDENPQIQMVEVPDLMGMSAYNANQVATANGFNVTFTGSTNGTSATVIGQYPAAGEQVPRGTVLQIELRYLDGLD